MVVGIDDIMKMLDENNVQELQNKGVELGKKIESINVFILPLNKEYNTNVWKNCAKILASKSDEILEPYLDYLLEWIEDINWPGALIIIERLKQFKENKKFYTVYEDTVKRAFGTNRGMWIANLSKLIEDNEKLRKKLPENLIRIIEANKYDFSNNNE